MVHARNFFVIASIFLFLTACASAPEAEEQAEAKQPVTHGEPDRLVIPCLGECAQPPLMRSGLLSHLNAHQERILAREDYKKRIAPRITDVAYGPAPAGHLRDGDDVVVDENGSEYDGPLNWHKIEFDAVDTTDVEHRSLRGREVSGAHCFFARRPNRETEVFSLLVVHHRDRGDVLYLGGPQHPVTRVDTVALTDKHASPIRLQSEHIFCAFRDDQNSVGALIVPFEVEDLEPPINGPYFAVFVVTTTNSLRPTNRTTRVRRAAGGRGGEYIEEVVPIKEYGEPTVEYLGSFDNAFEAIEAAQEAIPPGRFQLRREHTYPTMPFQSYIYDSPDQFCPQTTECRVPRENLDVDIRPTFRHEELDSDEAEIEAESDVEDQGLDEEADGAVENQ